MIKGGVKLTRSRFSNKDWGEMPEAVTRITFCVFGEGISVMCNGRG